MAIAMIADMHIGTPARGAIPIQHVKFPESEVGVGWPAVGHRIDLRGVPVGLHVLLSAEQKDTKQPCSVLASFLAVAFFVSRSAGTQTTWLSEWTSMAAALGLTIGIEAAGLRAEGGATFGIASGHDGSPLIRGQVESRNVPTRSGRRPRKRAASPTGSGEPVTNDEVASSRNHVVTSGHQGTNVRTAGTRAGNDQCNGPGNRTESDVTQTQFTGRRGAGHRRRGCTRPTFHRY